MPQTAPNLLSLARQFEAHIDIYDFYEKIPKDSIFSIYHTVAMSNCNDTKH